MLHLSLEAVGNRRKTRRWRGDGATDFHSGQRLTVFSRSLPTSHTAFDWNPFSSSSFILTPLQADMAPTIHSYRAPSHYYPRRDIAEQLTPNDTQKWVDSYNDCVIRLQEPPTNSNYCFRVTLIVAACYIVAIAICRWFLQALKASSTDPPEAVVCKIVNF